MKKNNTKELKRKSILMKSNPLTQEARNEHILIDLVNLYFNP